MSVLNSRKHRLGALDNPTVGLFISTDAGATWQHKGWTGYIRTFYTEAGSDGALWSACGNGVLRSSDNGVKWRITTGWEVTEVLKVKVDPSKPSVVYAATAYGVFKTEDSGETWKRGVEAQTPWPIVTVAGHPPLLTLGGVIFVLHPKGNWVQYTIRPGAGVRRVAGRSTLILALTTHGLFRSTDRGKAWSEEPDCPPVAEILDLMIGEDRLFLLLTGGRVWSRPLVAG